MKRGGLFRRYWPEALLFAAVLLPWLSLLVLGIVWLWQGGHVWAWAIAAAVLSLSAWPLKTLVRRRADDEARVALGDIAEPSKSWAGVERDAWTDVLALADATEPFAFTELEPFYSRGIVVIETVARRFHPRAHEAWAQFTLPEVLLLVERLARDIRREATRHIPGLLVRKLRLSHLLWAQQQTEQYGEAAQTGWHVGFGLWRAARMLLHPIQAAGQETSGFFVEKTATVLSYRLRAYGTRLFLLEVGRAAIDLYSGRLALSAEEIRAARAEETSATAEPAGPVRIVLVGQVNAGKSSLLNALAHEVRSAVGPLPTTSSAVEYRLDIEGRPSVTVVDMPGLADTANPAPDLLEQAARADLILWVASATQPARALDRQALDAFRAWAQAQLARRPPPVILALTHVDELRPATEWAPPYDISGPKRPKARAIRAAMDAVARVLDLRLDAIVPVAIPRGQTPYNIDAVWARLAVELDEARLVQLDRLRFGQRGLRLGELAAQLGNAGRLIIRGLIQGG
jgi:predicted GTPase